MQGPVAWTPAVSSDGKVVCVVSNDYNDLTGPRLYAFNTLNGTYLWSISQIGLAYSNSKLSVVFSKDNKVIYFMSGQNGKVTRDQGLYAINATNGNPLWNVVFDNFPSIPVISNANKVVYTVGFHALDPSNLLSFLSAFNSMNGTKLWTFQTDSKWGISAPALSYDEKVVYVGVGVGVGDGQPEGYLYAINAADGTKLWSFKAGGIMSCVQSFKNTISSGDKVVYAGNSDSNLYAINAVDGTKLWNITTGGGNVGRLVLSNDGKVAYVGTQDSQLYAINTEDGTKLWNFKAGSSGNGYTSPVVSSDGTVVYTEGRNSATTPPMYTGIYAIDAADGSTIWNFNTAGPGPSPTLSIDGKVVYTGGKGKIKFNKDNLYAQVYAINT